ncbi:Ger(x)C family spore germination protein [Alkalihalobacterium elongatum]|uniref:Ger(x)C family spore germination protein n=1 Tax=Alkalihalobacterium elongatum TaxID=2675466 RepID=UPI001C1F29F0|nr:Ger(x)C family spore germination protein [Alkalihalobacterium elongatum]
MKLVSRGVLLLLIGLLLGCDDPNIQKPVIEDLGMIGVMGFDYVDDERVKVVVTLPQPQHDAKEQVQSYSTIVRMPHQSVMDISTLTEKVLSPLQLRVILFSEEYARKVGVWKALENLYRDPQVGTNIFIAVVKGSTEDIIKRDYKDKPEINVYLNELLKPRVMTAFSPFTTIHYFINKQTDEVADPSTPYLELVNENSLKITKVALFSGDKMIATLDPEEAKLVQAMKRRRNLPDISVMIPGVNKGDKEEMAILKFVATKFGIEANDDLSEPELFLHFYIRGSIVDYDGARDLANLEERRELENKISNRLEERVIKTVKQFQELGVDPAGFGEHFRIKAPREWDKEKWSEIFKQTDITTHVEIRIISTGTIS